MLVDLCSHRANFKGSLHFRFLVMGSTTHPANSYIRNRRVWDGPALHRIDYSITAQCLLIFVQLDPDSLCCDAYVNNNLTRSRLLQFLWMCVYKLIQGSDITFEQIRIRSNQSSVADTSRADWSYQETVQIDYIFFARPRLHFISNKTNFLTGSRRRFQSLPKWPWW